MEFNYIRNPITNRKVNINSKLGKNILNNYISQLGGRNHNNCPIRDFIYTLYDSDILIPQDIHNKSDKCFLRGTFVFEDQHGDVFNLLKHTGCNFGHSWWKTTHSQARFKKAIEATLEISKNKESRWITKRDKKDNLEKFYQYEHKLKPAIVYACDKECRNGTHCNDKGLEDPKEVLFMYHFKTFSEYGSKRYTLLKLEGHYSLSVGHTKAAVNRYVLKKTAKTGYSTTRREDCEKDKSGCKLKGKQICNIDECKSALLEQYHIQNFISQNGEQVRKPIYDSVRFYNKHIRTGDEFYVPQPLTIQLLERVLQNQPKEIQALHSKPNPMGFA